jgi:UrcA family protein
MLHKPGKNSGAPFAAPKGANMSKLALAAAAALILAGPVLAAPAASDDAATRIVSTHGVDFNDQAQVRQFYAKLQNAARMVCQSGSPDRLVVATEDLSCVRRNMQDSVKAVDAPRLTAMLDRTYGPDAGAGRAFANDAR